MESVAVAEERKASVETDDTADPVPNALRIERIRTELWVPYPEATEALEIMTRLLNAPNEKRPESFALIGDPSFGKSYLLDRFIDRNVALDGPLEEEPTVPIVYIEMPESPEPAAMLREILSRIGAVFSLREPVDELMRRITVLTESLRIQLFIIDEFHKGFEGTHRQQKIMLNVARGLTNRTGRPLVVAGTEDVDSFLRNDTQLNERFIRRRLRRWSDGEETRRLLKGFERQLALRQPSKLASSDMTTHIVQLTGGRLGRISRLLVLAAEGAIVDGTEIIDKARLSKVAKQLPGESLVA